MKRAIIVVAGGKGLRMGGDLPKQFIPLNGKPVLMNTLEVFHQWDQTASLILVIPEIHQSYWKMLCKELACKIPHQVVGGGETRFHSVQNGLQQVKDCDLIGIHDGVRPLVTHEVIEACFVAAKNHGAAIPVVPVIESIRERVGENSQSVDREKYCIVQTPQVFCRDWLLKAYEQLYNPSFTDDASVVEAIGKSIYLVAGNRENIKITTPIDLIIAEKIICG